MQRCRENKARVFFLCLSASVFLCLFAYAEEVPVILEYRYTPGQVLHYRHELLIKGDQGALEERVPGTVDVSGETSQALSAKMISRITMETKAVETDGSAWVDVRYDAFDISSASRGDKLTKKGEADPDTPFKDMIGKTIPIRFQKDGRLLEVADPPGETPGPSFRLLVEQFKQMYSQMEGFFPDHPVQIGEKWERTSQIQIPNLPQKMTVSSHNTFESFERIGTRNCAKIKSVLKISLPETAFQPPQTGGGKPLDLSVKMEGWGESEQYFDPLEGVMVKSQGVMMTKSTQMITLPVAEENPPPVLQSSSSMELTFTTGLE